MYYKSYACYFRELFGCRVQKLSVNGAFSCPNRDGSRGYGGCTFCTNDAFSPSYCQPDKSISRQLDEGIAFHRWRYRKSPKYLAYFQSYSNTYAPLNVLRQRYEEALSHEWVVGIVVSTRPDCIDDEKLDYLSSLAKEKFVAIEYGIESCYDRTLRLVNRGHDFATACHAIEHTAERGIHCGAHLILGLPGETQEEMLAEADLLNRLPIDTLKLHQLQIIKGTTLHRQIEEGLLSVTQFSVEQYVSLVCDFRMRLRPDIIIERYVGEVPPRFVAYPERSWRDENGKLLRNEQLRQIIENELKRRMQK